MRKASGMSAAVYEFGFTDNFEERWILTAVFALKMDADAFVETMLATKCAKQEWLQARRIN